MPDELTPANAVDYPREQYQIQAPIGRYSSALAARVALGRLLRLFPYADLTSIQFVVVDLAEGGYDGPGLYVVARATEPAECPSCHTEAGHHPHTEYCRRMGDLENRDYPGQPGQRAQAVHRPFPDDGVTYCGWHVGDGVVHEGCGEVWPCSKVRAEPATPACVYPAANNGDGRGCEHDDCPRHGAR